MTAVLLNKLLNFFPVLHNFFPLVNNTHKNVEKNLSMCNMQERIEILRELNLSKSLMLS